MGNTVLGGIKALEGLEQLKAMRLENTQNADKYAGLQSFMGTLGQEPKALPVIAGSAPLPATEHNSAVPGRLPSSILDALKIKSPDMAAQYNAMPDQSSAIPLPQTQFNKMVGGVFNAQDFPVAQKEFDASQFQKLASAFPAELAAAKIAQITAPPVIHDTAEGATTQLINPRTGQVQILGSSPKTTDFMRELIAAGIKPGTPEFAKAISGKMAKDQYIPQLDPLERAKLAAETDLAQGRGALIKGTGLDPETIEFRAQMWAAGDQDGAFKGIPGSIYGSPARNAISTRGAQLASANGGGGAEQAATSAAYAGNKAGIRTAATAGAKMDTLATEVNKFADIAKQASAKVPRSSFVPLSKAEQMIQAGTSSPELAAFVAANTSLVNAYSAVAGRGTPTVSGQEHAYKMLSTAMGPEAYNAVVEQLLRETEAAKQSPNVTMEDIRKRITAPSGGGATMPAKSNPSATGGNDMPTTAAPPGSPSASDGKGNTIYYYGGKWQR